MKAIITLFSLLFLISACNLTVISDENVSGEPEVIVPTGQRCIIDADCVCTATQPDACGKVGQVWRCVAAACELRPDTGDEGDSLDVSDYWVCVTDCLPRVDRSETMTVEEICDIECR